MPHLVSYPPQALALLQPHQPYPPPHRLFNACIPPTLSALPLIVSPSSLFSLNVAEQGRAVVLPIEGIAAVSVSPFRLVSPKQAVLCMFAQLAPVKNG